MTNTKETAHVLEAQSKPSVIIKSDNFLLQISLMFIKSSVNRLTYQWIDRFATAYISYLKMVLHRISTSTKTGPAPKIHFTWRWAIEKIRTVTQTQSPTPHPTPPHPLQGKLHKWFMNSKCKSNKAVCLYLKINYHDSSIKPCVFT